MIRVEQMHFAYPAGPVLAGLGLGVEPGEILSIVGPNGCGKSTFLKLLRGVLKPTRGHIAWEGRSLNTFHRQEMAQKAAVVSQGSEVYFAYTVRELVAMGRFAHRTLLAAMTAVDRAKIDEAMAITDVEHLASRPATELSGGELQRVMLARALAQDTPALLLDEATSHLDLIHRLAISELLVQLNRETGKTILQVSHDLDLAAETSHRILLFSREGAIAALGEPAKVFTAENIRAVFGVEVAIEANPYSGAPRIYPLKTQTKA